MSLSSLNAPPLVAALSAGTFSLIPWLNQTFTSGATSWTVIKGANLAAYGLSAISVSRPGRYDGQDARDKKASEGMEKLSSGKRGLSLVPPAGWAFVIWAPIFLGELVMVGSLLNLSESSPVAPIVRQMTGPYVAAQVFQTLWTASFRPKYQGRFKFVSAINLSGIAYSLSLCHKAYAESPTKPYATTDYWIYFLPISLHFGWTTAASLVNWNGMVAMEERVSAVTVAWLGHASAIAAAVTGVVVTWNRSAPVYGGVIAWALAAVASGLSRRIQESEKEDANRVGVYGAGNQRILCLMGAFLCAGTSLSVSLIGKKHLSRGH